MKVERSLELTGMEQDATGVRAKYRHADGSEEWVEGAWLLGCDGAHSGVRHLLGMTFQGAQYEEEFLLADVKVDSELPTNEAHLFLSKEGLFAYFPFRGGRGRLILADQPGTKHESAEPTLAELEEYVRRRSSVPMTISDPAWTAWFRVSHRLVEHYRSGRVFLAGDAAHIHSPAGGQGMNTGIQDAFNLAWKVALVTRGIAKDELLDSYEAERLPVAKAVVNLTDRMTRMGTTQNPAAQMVRDHLLPLMTGIPFIKEALTDRMSEVGIGYRHSAWVENHGHGPVHAGDRAPDIVLFDRTAMVERRLFELLQEPGFVLLEFSGNTAGSAVDLGKLPGKSYQVRLPGKEASECSLEDRDCWAGKTYGAGEKGLWILVRPDGYVGFRGESAEALKVYLARLQGAA